MALNPSIARIQRKIDKYAMNNNTIDADADNNYVVFLGFLTAVCDIVRAMDPRDPGFEKAVSDANDVLNEGIEYGYNTLDIDFLPSFAHSAEYPVLTGPHREEGTIVNRVSEMLGLVKRRDAKKAAIPVPKLPQAWTKTPRPHPLSSLLARFELDGRGGQDYTTPLVRAMYDARCETTSDSIAHPISMSHNGTCLLISSMGGYKNRSPILTYYLLDETRARTQFPLKARHATVGLTDPAWTSATDESRKLMFVADKWRVKSYAWADAQTGALHRKGLPTHTLESEKHHGPLHVLAPGRLLRAGKGSVALWDMDTLPTHGPDGDARVGGKFDADADSDDDDNEIENSAGSALTSVLPFADAAKLSPNRWHAHPHLPATLLCGADMDVSRDCACVAVDLAHGGRTAARYLGHGGGIHAFSTSAGEPQVFATAASDGHARLYDQRVPLPVLTLRAGSAAECCGGVLFVHPDGVPTVITGATENEVIRVWDVRARKTVYELATGNNAVNGMTWDAPRSTLYVSTVCEYMDMGEHFGYRRAKGPSADAMMMELDSEDEDEDSEDEDEAPCWPQRAAHAEDYFGHLFDAGDHRLLRYAFKEQPDPSVLPEYGDARMPMEEW
ncbi:hypothetical protein C8R46DRAFT_1343810 [Mycena filopes]|nr:hypothetical protein C8R46DRAFT_1343810 [Mycena filopes]